MRISACVEGMILSACVEGMRISACVETRISACVEVRISFCVEGTSKNSHRSALLLFFFDVEIFIAGGPLRSVCVLYVCVVCPLSTSRNFWQIAPQKT